MEWFQDETERDNYIGGDPDSKISDYAGKDISSLLIREFIQNSLDNRVNRGNSEIDKHPAIINIYFKESKEAMKRYLRTCKGDLIEHMAGQYYSDGGEASDRQWKRIISNMVKYINHVKGKKTRLKMKDRKQRNMKAFDILCENPNVFLVLEDYNTTGLTGRITNYKKKPESEGGYKEYEKGGGFKSYIFNEVGLSEKRKRSGGSFGYGRTSVLYASSIESKLVYTRRKYETDSEVISGVSSTQARIYKGRTYRYRSSLVEVEDSTIGNPKLKGVTNPFDISELKKDFSLRNVQKDVRSVDVQKHSGTSIIIPFPLPDLNEDNMHIDIILNYGVYISKKQLVVILHSKDSKKQLRVYDHDTLLGHMKTIIQRFKSKKEVKKKERKKVEMIECLSILIPHMISARPEDCYKLNAVGDTDVITAFKNLRRENPEKFEEIKRKYKEYQYLQIKICKEIEYTSKEVKEGNFVMYIKRIENHDQSGYSLLMRGFTLYLNASREKENYVCLTIAENDGEQDNPYEQLLKSREPADHTKIMLRKAKNGAFSDDMDSEVVKIQRYLSHFIDANEICAFFEEEIRPSVKYIESDHFRVSFGIDFQPASQYSDGFETTQDPSDPAKLEVRATPEFIEKFREQNVRITVYYKKEGETFKITPQKKRPYPRLEILASESQNIAVRSNGTGKNDENTSLVHLKSPQFLIVLKITPSRTKYVVEYKLGKL